MTYKINNNIRHSHMKTKLTLRLEEDLIERAKAWARSRSISLSRAVAEFFEQLPEGDLPGLSPWTRRLAGAADRGRPPTDEEVRRDRLDDLEAKYE